MAIATFHWREHQTDRTLALFLLTAMPFAVKAFDVKLAAPTDAAIEVVIAREVVALWNAREAQPTGIVLVPEIEKAGTPRDVLIAFFRTADGAPVDTEAQAVESEIDAQLQAGRPVLVYFSEARQHFDHVADHEVRGLEAFKKRHAAQAAVDSFSDEKEFRSKFLQQLDDMVRSHAYFKDEKAAPVMAALAVISPATEMMEEARRMLFEACEDPEAYIGRFKDGNILKLQANGKNLVDLSQPGVVEIWEKAFGQLIKADFIRDAGCHGRLFQISAKGFEYLKTLGKVPVGYIAELGGM